jgi:hypothetical protein
MKKSAVLLLAVTIITGLVFSVPAFAGTATVATKNGDYTDPVAAMNDLAAWCGVPSETNPCLLKIKSGTYRISTPLVMQDHVSIVGSDPQDTTIESLLLYGATGIITAADAELSDLSVQKIEKIGCDPDPGIDPECCQSGYGLSIKDTHARIRNVNVILNNGLQCPAGVNKAIEIDNRTAELKVVLLDAVETDVLWDVWRFTTGATIAGNVAVSITDSVIKESGNHYGLAVSASGGYEPWVSILNSTISSGWHAFKYVTSETHYVNAAYSEIVGDLSLVPAGAMNCVGLYRPNGSSVTCP